MNKTPKSTDTTLHPDPLDTFNKTCKTHISNETSQPDQSYIFGCYDCKKMICPICYSKHHRKCSCDLIENIYKDMISNVNEIQIKLSDYISDFKDEVSFMNEKHNYFIKNNPFQTLCNIITKIFDNIYDKVSQTKNEIITTLKQYENTYMYNIEDNITRIKNEIHKAENINKRLLLEYKKISKQTPFDYCNDMLIHNTTLNIINEYEEIETFAKHDFTRICQGFIDTNTIVYNDTESLLTKAKTFREFILDKIIKFNSVYTTSYTVKHIFSLIMNSKQFILYSLSNNQLSYIKYNHDYIIPAFTRWIPLTYNKLFVTGGEHNYIDSLNECYMFKFKYIDNTRITNVDVVPKASMLYKRRAHSLIYCNDYIYAISGVDQLQMIKKCEKYDIYNDKWIEIPELNYNRQNATLVVHNYKYLYVFCGYDGFRNLNSFEKIDLMNEDKGWEVIEFRNTLQDSEDIDIRKNRIGCIKLDFDRVLLFGGERNGGNYKEGFIYEMFEKKFYMFSELEKETNFIMNNVYSNGKYIMFDYMNNIHEMKLELLNFEYKEFFAVEDNNNHNNESKGNE